MAATILGWLALLSVSLAQAATFEFVTSAPGPSDEKPPWLAPGAYIAMRGDLVDGDAAKLGAMLTENRRPILVLDGVEGGDFNEGVRLATTIYDQYVGTVVPTGKACVGPCAVAFMAGRVGCDGDDTTCVLRCMHEGSRVDLGLPSFSTPQSAVSGNTDLTAEARNRAFRFLVDLLALTERHNWPQSLVAQLMDAGPGGSVALSPSSTGKDFTMDGGFMASTLKFAVGETVFGKPCANLATKLEQ